jgi:hypothetical protein
MRIAVVAPVSNSPPSRRLRHAGPAPWPPQCPTAARRARARSGATSGPAGAPRRPAPAGREPPQVPRSAASPPARGARMAQFPKVRWSAHFGLKRRPIVRGCCPKLHAIQKVGSCGQGRNRTIDTRILNATERPVRCEQAQQGEGVSAGATEPPCPTEPIPNRNAELPTKARGARSGSTTCAHRVRTFSEPRCLVPTGAAAICEVRNSDRHSSRGSNQERPPKHLCQWAIQGSPRDIDP